MVFGRSSPIVSGGRVFVTGVDGDYLVTAAYSASTGKPSWRRAMRRGRVDDISTDAGPAVATPVSDGRNVYAFFPEYGLVSYDHTGGERWRLELPQFASYYGMAASPVLEGGVLVLVCDQSREPFVIGVETETGKQAHDVNPEVLCRD